MDIKPVILEFLSLPFSLICVGSLLPSLGHYILVGFKFQISKLNSWCLHHFKKSQVVYLCLYLYASFLKLMYLKNFTGERAALGSY